MIFRGKKPVTAFLAVAALVTAFIASGCSGNNNNQTGWTLVGKVVDANSRVGVAGARVCVKINGDWNGHCAKSSTGTSGNLTANSKPKYDVTTTVGSTVGDFSIPGLPYLANPTPVSVQAPVGSTYSDTTTTVFFSGSANGLGLSSAGNANGEFDMGDVFIDQGVTVNIFVITNTPATPVNTNGSPIYWVTSTNGDVLDVPATYVSGNQYTITLPRSGTGSPAFPGALGALLTISPFKSADGTYFLGASTNVKWQDLTVEAHPTINLTVTATTMVTPLATVATNFLAKKDNSTPVITTFGLAKNGVIKLYLNEPITLVAPTSSDTTPAVPNPYVISLSFVDYFKSLTMAPVTVVQAVTAAVNATDPALLTITPTNALTENQTYAFAGRVQAASDWASQPGTNNASAVNLDTVPGAGPFYVYPAAATVAGSIGPVQMDNGNGWTAFASGVLGASSAKIISTEPKTVAGVGKPRLMFPEMVWGTIRLIDYPGTVFVFSPKAITGTLTYVNNNLVTTRAGVQITGIGTSFTTQLQIGDQLTDANNVIWTIGSIDSDTSLFAVSTSQSAVPNTATPGVTATITLREGYYTYTNPASGPILTSSQRVPSTFVNDAHVGDVLSIASATLGVTPTYNNPVTVTGVTPVQSGTGFGRELVVSLASAATTVTVGTTVENGGKGHLKTAAITATDLSLWTINGSWGGPATPLLALQAAANGTTKPVLADYTTGVPPQGGPATTYYSAANLAADTIVGGAGYTINALSLVTSHANGACSGVTFNTLGAGALAATGTIAGGTGCHNGDLLAVLGGATAPTGTVGLIQIQDESGGTPVAGASAAGGYQLLLAGGGYANATYQTVFLGTYLNATVPGAYGAAATGIEISTANGTVANNDATLGAVGSTISSSCADTTIACIVVNGSAGAIAGDILTVHNPNAGSSAAAAAGASAGTIRITAIDQTTGRVSAGVVVSSGAKYPSVGVARVQESAGVKTAFAQIALSQALSISAPPTITAGSNGARNSKIVGLTSPIGLLNTDLQKFGGAQVRALEDYVLANGGNGNDIAALTYSVEYTKSCGNGTDSANTMGPQAGAEVGAKVAWIQSSPTNDANNFGGFDAPSFFGSAAGGPALLCDLSDGNMFGWLGGTTPSAATGATAIPGPMNNYVIQDSSTGTRMRIRLDVNVVDMAGNSLKALDTSYDVH